MSSGGSSSGGAAAGLPILLRLPSSCISNGAMPEDPEIDTDKLSETIHEKLEHQGGAFLRTIALTTTLLAAVAAISSLQAGATANEALVLKTEATRLQAEASDQWAFYQAKGIKSAVAQASEATWQAVGRPVPAELEANVIRYGKEQEEIKKVAEEKERERDAKSSEADTLLRRHHVFANAVALFQVSIALGALAALTRVRAVWYGSLGLGVIGVGLFGWQFLVK